MFKGTLTALVTPFREGTVDFKALRELCEWQIASGINGLVVCGSTGEAAAMTTEERLAAVEAVVAQARKRVLVIAGSGTNNTQSTLELTKAMIGLKVDGVLVVTPYYVKPTQAGLIEHYRQVASLGAPVVAYNVPGRTGVTLNADTVGVLSRIKNLVAVKEATGDLKLNGCQMRAAEGRLAFLSGDDYTYLPFLSIGGHGCISVVSNVAPGEMAQLYNCWVQGDIPRCQEIHLRLLPLMEMLFAESNPIPVKAALAMLGRISWEIRLPLTPLSEPLRPKLEKTLAEAGIRRG